MADTANNSPDTPARGKAGALKSTLTVQLHTQYAILLWEGRQRQKESKKPQIVSMPQVIARAGKINADSDTLATEMMKSPDRNLALVKGLLGHRSVSTTMEYVELDLAITGQALEDKLSLYMDVIPADEVETSHALT